MQNNQHYLIEKIVRLRIYEDRYWKEHCFALDANGLIDKVRLNLLILLAVASDDYSSLDYNPTKCCNDIGSRPGVLWWSVHRDK